MYELYLPSVSHMQDNKRQISVNNACNMPQTATHMHRKLHDQSTTLAHTSIDHAANPKPKTKANTNWTRREAQKLKHQIWSTHGPYTSTGSPRHIRKT